MREMKDSGVEWIGEIPKDWNLGRIKYYSEITLGKMLQNDPKGNFDTNEYYLCAANIGGFTLNLNSIKKMWFSKAEKNKLNLSKGDLLVVEGGDVGSCVYLEKDLLNIYFQNSINRVKTNYKLDIRLIKYILFLAKKVGYIDLICNKATISHLTKEKLEEIFCIVPENTEQQQIADFLDTKCSEIDATAEDIQKEISLLEDYKKSVITEAVTKGLDPDAEMKDSGIAWIGEVPKHWGTIRIGNAFSIRNERNYLPMEQVQLLSLYSGKGVFPTGEEGTTNRGNHAQTVADYKIVKKNDIVVNIILAWMGSLGISNYNGVVSPAYDVYIPNEEKVVPHYYHYVFRTSGIANECYRYGRGIMMMRWRTYSSEFKRIHVPFPPLEEQQQIADFLDTKCSEIDAIIADKKRQLDILAEYKKSLIYEYVTGKKEVPINE